MPPSSGEQQVDHIPETRLKGSTTTSCPDLALTDDDNSSVSSFSSFSTSTADKTVSWSTPLVVEVRTRERTRPEDLSLLFYTCQETQRFRQEYRLERRRAAEDEAACQEALTSCSEGGVNSLLPSWSYSNRGADTMSAQDSCSLEPIGKHRISRVVVMHKNTLETFVDQELSVTLNSQLGDFNSVNTSNHPNTTSSTTKTASNDFFDNDSFWSGQITWY